MKTPRWARADWVRSLAIVLAAAVIVLVVGLVLRAVTGEPSPDPGGGAGRPPSPPSVLPADDRLQPSQQEWTDLLPDLQEAAAVAPDDVDAQTSLALAYYNLGRFAEAAAIYERLLAAGEDPVLRDRLGNVLRDMGDTAGAEAAYRSALAGDPTLVAPYLNLAELLWRQARDDEALALIDAGLAAVPDEDRAALLDAREALAAETPNPEDPIGE